jgi:hypothetical protein
MQHDPDFVAAHPEVPWAQAYRMRNALSHGERPGVCAPGPLRRLKPGWFSRTGSSCCGRRQP